MAASVLRFAGLYLALSLVLSALALLHLWPWRPTTALGWLAFLLGALPIAALGEWLGQLVLENRFAARLGSNTAADSVSWLRIAYGVGAVVVLIAIVGGVYAALAVMTG